MRFSLGQVVATPGALEALRATGQTPDEFLRRHADGDWGVVCPEDKTANDAALGEGARIVSSYVLADGDRKVWLITEADRSSTCLLLPEEY
jgi:hypothetical protein